jgi:hypothetical protein
MLISDFTLTQNINIGDSVIYGLSTKLVNIQKGDYILFLNSVWSEIMQVTSINLSSNSLMVNRPFQQYAFLISDPTVTMFWNDPVYFQPILLNFGENIVNYPVLFQIAVKYLNT